MGHKGPERKETHPRATGKLQPTDMRESCPGSSAKLGAEMVADGARKASKSSYLVWGGDSSSRCDLGRRGGGKEGRFSGDTRSSYKPRSHMPKFGSVWEDPPEFRQKDSEGRRKQRPDSLS